MRARSFRLLRVGVRTGGCRRPASASAAAGRRLAGLTFSGAAAEDGPYGTAWVDGHPPLLSADPASKSLLDDARVAAALDAAGALPVLGIKVSRLPSDRTASDVVATIARNLDVVRRLAV